MEVLEAARVVTFVPVHDGEGLGAAGRQEEVVAAVGILVDVGEAARAVAPEVVAGGDEQGLLEVEGLAGAELLAGVGRGEEHEVGDLAALDVGDGELVAFRQNEGGAGLGGEGGHRAVVILVDWYWGAACNGSG